MSDISSVAIGAKNVKVEQRNIDETRIIKEDIIQITMIIIDKKLEKRLLYMHAIINNIDENKKSIPAVKGANPCVKNCIGKERGWVRELSNCPREITRLILPQLPLEKNKEYKPFNKIGYAINKSIIGSSVFIFKFI